MPDAEAGFDARDLPEDPDGLAGVLDDHAVFGRVTPHQKRAMVEALQSRGHTVAMTGDGVNDVLALKDADMGIAMGSGSEATRSVAQLVLLDDRFGTLPRVLAEGRRVINNIERVANLFITKATYAVLLTALVGLLGAPFPFLPKQLTLIGTFSIGVPGFFLALAPDTSLVRPGFLPRVLRYSGLGLVILLSISRPLRPWKLGLALAMAASYVLVMALEVGRDYFELDAPPTSAWVIGAVCVAVGGLAISQAPRLATRRDG